MLWAPLTAAARFGLAFALAFRGAALGFGGGVFFGGFFTLFSACHSHRRRGSLGFGETCKGSVRLEYADA